MADGGQTELSLFLTLNSGGVDDALTSLEQKFATIEESVTNIATAVSGIQMPDLSVASGGLDNLPEPDVLESLAEQTGDFSGRVKNLQANLENMQVALTMFLTGQEELGDSTVEVQRRMYDLIQQTLKYNTTQQAAIGLTKEETATFEALRGKMYELKREIDENAEMNKVWEQTFTKLSGNMGEMGGLIRSLVSGKMILAETIAVVSAAMMQISDEMDTFAKANYEAAGSVYELMGELRNLQGNFAATAEDAKKAGSAIMLAGFHMDDNAEAVQKLSERAVMYSFAYGVSEQSTAKFAASLTAMGSTLDSTMATMDFAAKAVSFAGLSADEASSLFDKLNDAAWEAYAMYGSAQAANEFSRGLSTMAAAARKAQVPLDDVLAATIKIMKGGPDMIMALGGAAFNTTPSEKMAASMEKLPELMDRMMNMTPELREQMVKAMTGYDSMAQLKSMHKLGEEIGFTGEALEKYQKKIEAEQEAEEAYQDTLKTLTGAFKQFLMPVMSTLTSILVPLAQAFVFLMKPLVVFGKMLGKVFSTEVGRGILYVVGAVAAFRIAWTVLNLTVAKSLIGITILGVAWALEKLMDSNLPDWLKYVVSGITLLSAALVIFYQRAMLASLGTLGFGKKLKGLAGGLKGVKGPLAGLGDKFKSFFSITKKSEKMGGPNPAMAKTFKASMKGFADGLMVFAKNSMKILQGAATFAAAMTLLAIPVLLVALVVKKLGISGAELAIVAGVMLAAMLVMALVVPILAGVGAGFTAILPLILAFAIGLAIIGLAMIPAAYAFGIFAAAAIKLAEADLVKLGLGMASLGLGFVVFAAGAILLLPASIALLAGAVVLLAATAAMAAAMLLFPTTDFGNMAAHLMTFAKAMAMVPKGIGGRFGEIRDVLDDLDDMEDSDLSALFKLSAGYKEFMQAAAALSRFAYGVDAITDAVARVQKVEITDALTQDVIDNEPKFKKAAQIIGDYADAVAGYIDKIPSMSDVVIPAAAVEEAAEVSMSGLTGTATPVAGTVASTLERTKKVSRDSGDKMVKLMEKQSELLGKLDRDPDNSNLEQKLQKVVERLDELIDRMRGSPGVGEASTWQ